MPCSGDLVFVHIPKTGGTSVLSLMPDATLSEWWGPVHQEHMTARELWECGARGRYFAVVRDPLERALSEYCYWRAAGYFPYLEGMPSFEEWCEAIRDVDPWTFGMKARHLLAQCEFVSGVRVELYTAAQVGPAIFGQELPRLNSWPRVAEHTWRTRHVVSTLYAEDMVLWESVAC